MRVQCVTGDVHEHRMYTMGYVRAHVRNSPPHLKSDGALGLGVDIPLLYRATVREGVVGE